MKRLLAPALAPVVACALALAGCTPWDSLENALDNAPQEMQQEAPQETALPEPGVENSYAPYDEDEYEDVDPELFRKTSGAIVGFPDEQAGCTIKDGGTDRLDLSVCQVNFRYPMPPVEFDGGWVGAPLANVVSFNYDTGEFETGQSPGSQGFFEEPRMLEPGQRVTLWGTTMISLLDGGVRVERDGTGFTLRNGVIQMDKDPQDRFAQAAQPVEFGTVCGTVYSPGHGLQEFVVAYEDGMLCSPAMDVMEDYVRGIREGESQGTGAFWHSSNGWGCAAGYRFDDEEFFGYNGKLSCSDDEGTGGSVVVVKPDDLSRVR